MPSTASSLPDYYQVLGVSPSADADAIRKAYRAQARKYHPDAAPENPYAAAQFRALRDAYNVLSEPQNRRRYDEERWLRGMTSKQSKAIDSAGLLADSGKLLRHLQRIGQSAVAPHALQSLLLYLLQDKHLAILSAEADAGLNDAFSGNIFESAGYLPPRLGETIYDRLALLKPVSAALGEKLARTLAEKRRRQKTDRMMPWIIVLITALLCVLMALSHK